MWNWISTILASNKASKMWRNPICNCHKGLGVVELQSDRIDSTAWYSCCSPFIWPVACSPWMLWFVHFLPASFQTALLSPHNGGIIRATRATDKNHLSHLNNLRSKLLFTLLKRDSKVPTLTQSQHTSLTAVPSFTLSLHGKQKVLECQAPLIFSIAFVKVRDY